MITNRGWILPLLCLVFAAGCGPSNGFLIKPVPTDEKLQETTVSSDGGLFLYDKIAVIDVDGLIMNVKESGLMGSGENPVAQFVEKMNMAQADNNVKAVVLRINSPGGGVTASDIMYRRVMQLKAARQMPVVAVIEDVGASGGYYLACGCDQIIAAPTSVTGSIGVIVQTVSFAGTMEKIGVTAKAITSGTYKDMGSPLKPLDPKDQDIIKGIVTEFYGNFLDVVTKNRAASSAKLSREKVQELADGRVYTGAQAEANGLIDQVGTLEDGIAQARKLAGVSRAKVVMYNHPYGAKTNIYSAAGSAPAQMNMVNITVPNLMMLAEPQFLYLWTGR